MSRKEYSDFGVLLDLMKYYYTFNVISEEKKNEFNKQISLFANEISHNDFYDILYGLNAAKYARRFLALKD